MQIMILTKYITSVLLLTGSVLCLKIFGADDTAQHTGNFIIGGIPTINFFTEETLRNTPTILKNIADTMVEMAPMLGNINPYYWTFRVGLVSLLAAPYLTHRYNLYPNFSWSRPNAGRITNFFVWWFNNSKPYVIKIFRWFIR